MKKMVAMLVFICLCVSTVSAQELQFGTPIFIELEGNTATVGSIDSYTLVVEEGKAVKLTGVSTGTQQSNQSYPSFSGNIRVHLNGKLLYSGTATINTEHQIPVWLPAGSYLVELVNSSAAGGTGMAYVSGIEFNIGQ